ncbi:hypothetical protein [Pseudobutyrivibrio sp. YE44]|uniref:hypothetical protein n=1 Tax=Pseudobutyrivibrio sp. YE44 TaxID=1520802 RepID=UPI00115FE3E6|nr:hypothetical protein [Pseudobutyrivibrio sp. YE44]
MAIYLLALTKEELTTLLKVVVYVATALFVIGIFESITSIRPFDALYTAQRYMLNDHYVRLGLLRATTTLGLPGFYGNMCILMLPAIFYLYEITRHKRFLVIAGLDILAMIHSGSRSDVFFTTAVIIAYFLYVVKGKERKLLFCKNALAVICSLLLVVIACSLINDNLRYFYSGSCKAVLNEVGFDFDLDKDAPDDVNGFGVNPTGSISRTRQLSGLTYTARINPIFGLGSGAQVRGDVQYYWKDEWHVVYSYDLGFVETFCDEGFIGILAMISLFIFMIATSKNSRFLQLSVFSYLLSTLSTANMYTFLFAFILIEISLRKQNG